jgi:hypothetical protein
MNEKNDAKIMTLIYGIDTLNEICWSKEKKEFMLI